jgi:hypothetical protein
MYECSGSGAYAPSVTTPRDGSAPYLLYHTLVIDVLKNIMALQISLGYLGVGKIFPISLIYHLAFEDRVS